MAHTIMAHGWSMRVPSKSDVYLHTSYRAGLMSVTYITFIWIHNQLFDVFRYFGCLHHLNTKIDNVGDVWNWIIAVYRFEYLSSRRLGILYLQKVVKLMAIASLPKCLNRKLVKTRKVHCENGEGTLCKWDKIFSTKNVAKFETKICQIGTNSLQF